MTSGEMEMTLSRLHVLHVQVATTIELRAKLERRQSLGQRSGLLQRKLHFLQTLKETEALLGIKGGHAFVMPLNKVEVGYR
jgi:hypothetical protein